MQFNKSACLFIYEILAVTFPTDIVSCILLSAILLNLTIWINAYEVFKIFYLTPSGFIFSPFNWLLNLYFRKDVHLI